MILSSTTGIITSAQLQKSKKTGNEFIVLSYTAWNSETLQKKFIFNNDENYQELRLNIDALIGQKITQKIELN